MKKFFKALSLFGLLIASVIFGLVFLEGLKIPDEINILEGDSQLVSNVPRTAAYVNSYKSVSTRGSGGGSYVLDFKLLKTIPIKSSSVTVRQRRYVVPGGEAFGLKLYSDGVMAVGFDEVLDGGVKVCPGREAGLEAGDVITALDGKRVTRSAELIGYLKSATKSNVRLSVSRDGKPFETELSLVRDEGGAGNKAGLWIRDSTAGVGTLTYYRRDNMSFAGLGHAVCDVDTGRVIPLLYGDAVGAVISGCYKSEGSVTGELCGVFTVEKLGDIVFNRENGVYGTVKKIPSDRKEIPVASKQEVHPGEAEIISTVNGNTTERFSIKIVRICNSQDKNGKNFTLKVTDDRLLEKTGGIVQGMSGSPIIQDGMLAGAVTHVFVNDPTQGYGIFAENMLEISDSIAARQNSKAS